MTGPQACRYIA